VSQTLLEPETQLDDWVLITLLVAELQAGGVRCPFTTRQLRDAATDQKIPATRISGRWHVKRSDLPVIRRRLGMDTTKRATASRKT
jgi:hypothetical protein